MPQISLQEVRQKYPQYDDLPDAVLAERLHSKFYSDMPREEFDQRIGLAAPQASSVPTPIAPPIASNPGGGGMAGNPLSAGETSTVQRTLFGRDQRRGVQVGAQAVGSGFANLLDIPAALTNATLALADKMPLVNAPYRFPYFGSDVVKPAAGRAMEAAGVPPIAEADMTPFEKVAYKASELGAESLAGGTMLARGEMAKQMAPGARTPRFGDAFTRSYAETPGKSVAVDTTAGAGAGFSLEMARQMLPEAIQGPITDFIATMLGGFAGAGAASAGRSVKQAAQGVGRTFADPAIPVDPATGKAVSKSTADAAAKFTQGTVEAGGNAPADVAARIGQRAEDARTAGDPVPTTGILSGDPGMVAIERGARFDSPVEFQGKDQKLRDAAQERVTGLRDETADVTKPSELVERTAAAKTEQAQRGVDKAAGDAKAVEMARQVEADQLAMARGTGDAASARLDQVVRGTAEKESARKTKLFEDIDPTGEVKVTGGSEAVRERVKQIRGSVPATVPADEVLPEKYLKTFEAAAEGREVTFKELNDARPYLSSAIAKARAANDYALADNLQSLKSLADDTAEALAKQGSEVGQRAQDAVENFKVRFAPRFREGEGGAFVADIKKDKFGTKTRPSETAARFLSGPEAAKDLTRILEVSENPEAGVKAARQWLLDRMSGVVKGDKIDPNRLRLFRDNNAGVLEQVPGLKKEVDQMVRDAVSGTAKENQLARDLKVAQSAVKRTEREIDAAATSVLLGGKDPVKAAGEVFAKGEIEGARRMKEIVTDLKRDPEALRGWKRAVTEHLIDKVTTTNTALSGGAAEGPVSLAQMQRFFSKNEKAMAEVFSPSEMNSLRRARKIIEPLGNLSRQVTAGSPTFENEQLWNSLEAGLLAATGNAITTGMILKRVKVVLKFLPDPAEKAALLIKRAQFDPELAQILLTRNVKEIQTPVWNGKLTTALAIEHASKHDEPKK